MKEETKNRLRKFGKVTAYCFGLFATLLLGVGLGNCSARGKSVKAEAVSELSLAEHKTLRPKRALDPAEWHTLSADPDNLLLDAQAGHFDFTRVSVDGSSGYTLSSASWRDMYLLELSAGAYIFDAPLADDRGYQGKGLFINSYGSTEVQQAFNGEPLNRVFIEIGDVGSSFDIQGTDPDRRVFNVTAPFVYFLVTVNNPLATGLKLSLYDPLKAPAVASYDFPVLFNPYPLGGSPANSDFIFNGPSVTEGTIVQTQTLYFNGLSFRSNGKLYNRIILAYKHDINQTFGHYDASGNFVLDGTLGSKAWFFDYMIYAYGSDYTDVAWNAKFESVDSNLAWKPALVSGGLWVAQEYRHIEVLSFDGSSLSGLPSTSLVLNSSVESVLKLISSYVSPSTSEMGNPFTLIREGFTAVGGILQIQILPFMTLGTLIFVPLVVLVILAILKLLAK